jgi:hypothetical protein
MGGRRQTIHLRNGAQQYFTERGIEEILREALRIEGDHPAPPQVTTHVEVKDATAHVGVRIEGYAWNVTWRLEGKGYGQMIGEKWLLLSSGSFYGLERGATYQYSFLVRNRWDYLVYESEVEKFTVPSESPVVRITDAEIVADRTGGIIKEVVVTEVRGSKEVETIYFDEASATFELTVKNLPPHGFFRLQIVEEHKWPSGHQGVEMISLGSDRYGVVLKGLKLGQKYRYLIWARDQTGIFEERTGTFEATPPSRKEGNGRGESKGSSRRESEAKAASDFNGPFSLKASGSSAGSMSLFQKAGAKVPLRSKIRDEEDSEVDESEWMSSDENRESHRAESGMSNSELGATKPSPRAGLLSTALSTNLYGSYLGLMAGSETSLTKEREE